MHLLKLKIHGQFRPFVMQATFAVLISGCVSGGQWVELKNGKPFDQSELNRDIHHCQKEAALVYPYAAKITSKGGGTIGRSSTNCQSNGNQINCSSFGGGYAEPEVRTTDGNEANRQQFYRSCMNSFGYERRFIQSDTEKTYGSSYIANPAGNMKCETDRDCPASQSCRSRRGGGTECR